MLMLGCLVCLSALADAAFASKIVTHPYPPGSQDPGILNAGLPDLEYGYHPDNNSSWGESWYMLALDEAGNQIWVLFSVSNYHPLYKFAGTVTLFYYEADGETHQGHAEFQGKDVRGDLERLDIDIGGNTIKGAYPTYRLKATAEGLSLDLIYEAEAPDLLLGQGRLGFGNKAEEYWTVGVIAPRAKVTGTVSANGREIPFLGKGYFDHGRSNIKLPKFSKWWFVLRIFDKDFNLGIINMIFKDNYSPGSVEVMYVTLGDRIIVNTGAVKIRRSGSVEHPESGVVYPDTFEIEYDLEGTKLTGTIKLTKMIGYLNVLDRLSALARTVVKTLYTDPWQFRLTGEADLTLEHAGQVRRITSGQVVGEVHYYK